MDYEIEKESWERAIGKFILLFGDVELLLLRLYKTKMSHRDYFADDFNSRFDKAIGVVRSEESDQSLIDALIELKKLSKYRHLIAHNPLYVDIFQHNETSQMHIEMSVSNKSGNGERITLENLQTACKKVSGLSRLLYEAFQGELWQSYDRVR